MKVKILCWDWKENVNFRELSASLRERFDGKNCPTITEVPNTGCDEHAIVIAPEKISSAMAQAAWEKFMELGWEKSTFEIIFVTSA